MAAPTTVESNHGLLHSDLGRNLLLTLPFLLLFWANLYHHQMWRDELNVWGIVLASPTLSSLAHNIHYEGHPGLWYYLAWVPTQFTTAPAALKWIEAVIGTGIYLVIGLASPWRWFEKVLVFLSYYVAFEYTVLSRMYGLFLLLSLCYIIVRVKKPQAVWLGAILIGLIANTDMVGVILSGALIVEYAWYLYLAYAQEPQTRVRALGKLGVIYLVFLLASYATLRPAKDISWVSTGHIGRFLKDPNHFLASVSSNVGLPWFSFSMHFPHKFWNPAVIAHPAFFAVASCFVAVSLYLIFRNSASQMTLIGLTILASITFSHLVYLGFMRHFGVVFVAFLLAYWIKRSQEPRVSRMAIVLLLISCVGGLEAIAGSRIHPFSNSGVAAQWIRDHHLQDEPLAGFEDFSSVAVAEQLGKPIYFPQCNCTDTYMKFSNRRDDIYFSHITRRLLQADKDMHTNRYLLILRLPLSDEQLQDLANDHQTVTLLADFSGAEEHSEDFLLYQVTHNE